MNAILTSVLGQNADLFPSILKLYVPEGSIVADVTAGKLAFWRNIDITKYDLRATDLIPSAADPLGTDFTDLPYADASLDALVLDPPYIHGGVTIKASLNDCYHNANTGHESVIRLYAGGILEAARVLKKKGIIIVKCQDEIESGKQCFSHIEITQLLQMFGFLVEDSFLLQQTSVPIQRQQEQHHARKNHSFFIVGRYRR